MTQANSPQRAKLPREIGIVGVPMDLGAGRRGVDMGPSAIRYAGLEHDLKAMGMKVTDYQNIAVPGPESADVGNPRAKFDDLIETACIELREQVAQIARGDAFPLVLGGDHSIAMGTLAGIARSGRRPGVIWVDAHGDMNTTETTPSGNVHGMPLAVAVGLGGDPFPEELRGSVDGRSAVLVATRSVDAGERGNIERAGVTAITRAPGVGTPVRGGLTYREAQLAMEMLASSGKLASIEVAEVNPVLDQGNRTAQLAVELIASALGQTIL